MPASSQRAAHEAVALVLRLGALLSGHDVDVLGVPDLDAGSLVEALPHGLGLLAFGVRTLGLLSRLARGLLALGRCGVLVDTFLVAGSLLVVLVEPGGSGLPGLQAEEHRVALVGPRQAVEVDDPQVLGERLVVQVVVARGPRRLLVKPAPGEHREGGVLVVPVGLLAHDREVRGVVAPGHAHVVRLARVERLHLARTRVDHAEPVAGLVGGVDGHREPRALLAPRKGTHATEVGVHAAREVADDEVGAVIVARLTVALHREEGAALAEGEGAHAFDGVLLTADEVEQTQVVLHGLLALGELLPLGLGLADGERQPLAVAGERRPAACSKTSVESVAMTRSRSSLVPSFRRMVYAIQRPSGERTSAPRRSHWPQSASVVRRGVTAAWTVSPSPSASPGVSPVVSLGTAAPSMSCGSACAERALTRERVNRAVKERCRSMGLGAGGGAHRLRPTTRSGRTRRRETPDLRRPFVPMRDPGLPSGRLWSRGQDQPAGLRPPRGPSGVPGPSDGAPAMGTQRSGPSDRDPAIGQRTRRSAGPLLALSDHVEELHQVVLQRP